MTENKWIKLSDEDSARIGCSSISCEKQATQVQHCHWDAGVRTGLSFFYFCDFHTDLMKQTGKSYEPNLEVVA